MLLWGKDFRGDLPGPCSGARGRDRGATTSRFGLRNVLKEHAEIKHCRQGRGVQCSVLLARSCHWSPAQVRHQLLGASGVQGRGAGGRSAPPAPGLRRPRRDPGTNAQAEHCAKRQEPEPLAVRGSPGGPRPPSPLWLRAHLPPPPPGSRSRCSPAEPGRRAASAASPGGRASPAPPCSRPPARPPGRRSRRLCVRTLPETPDPSRPRAEGPRGQAGALPATRLHLRPLQHLLPTLQPPSQRSSTTPPPGSLPYFAVPPHPRSVSPTLPHSLVLFTWMQVRLVEEHPSDSNKLGLCRRSPGGCGQQN